jgi:phage tail sheath protein FI
MSIYLLDIPQFDDSNNRIYDDSSERPSVAKTAVQFETRRVDNNSAGAYFPDVVIEDDLNNERVKVPPSVAAIAALGFNDAVSFPWFAPAGFNRGSLDFVKNTGVRLTAGDRDTLYDARVNPIANFPQQGFVIFGQKTLQAAQSALDRVNVRRLMLEVKRAVSEIANRILFEQNTPATRARFISQVTPVLATIQAQSGIENFKVVMDDSNNSTDDVLSNRLNGKVILVPTRAIEFISLDFVITNSGVSFE